MIENFRVQPRRSSCVGRCHWVDAAGASSSLPGWPGALPLRPRPPRAGERPGVLRRNSRRKPPDSESDAGPGRGLLPNSCCRRPPTEPGHRPGSRDPARVTSPRLRSRSRLRLAGGRLGPSALTRTPPGPGRVGAGTAPGGLVTPQDSEAAVATRAVSNLNGRNPGSFAKQIFRCSSALA